MTDIGKYLDFVIVVFLAFGIAFEVPIVTVVLVSFGATTPEALSEKRPYVIVGAFVVGMLLTPPDIISQTLLALPVWLLFEIGLVFSRRVVRRKAGGSDTEADEESRPLSDEEMEAELDAAEREENESEASGKPDSEGKP